MTEPICTCAHIRIGFEVTEARNWNPDCPEHGISSTWWNSDEQQTRRKRADRHLRALQRLARIKRRQVRDEEMRSGT